jgi:hypothetical protein
MEYDLPLLENYESSAHYYHRDKVVDTLESLILRELEVVHKYPISFGGETFHWYESIDSAASFVFEIDYWTATHIDWSGHTETVKLKCPNDVILLCLVEEIISNWDRDECSKSDILPQRPFWCWNTFLLWAEPCFFPARNTKSRKEQLENS